MIDLGMYKAVAGTELGEFVPKSTSFEGDNQKEASKTLWTSPDGGIRVGIWECTPGRFTADRSTSSELCHIIEGVVEMTRSDGSKQLLGPGDLLAIPRGWKGEWHIIETTRKLFVVHSDPQ